MCTSRSFGTLLTDKEEIKKAVANFAARCAFKLRRQGSCTGRIQVFLETNPFRSQDPQLSRQITIELPLATSSTNLLIVHAMNALDMLFKPGYNYHKAGLVVMDLVLKESMQSALWEDSGKLKNSKVMIAMDSINSYMGDSTVKFAAQGYSEKWKLRTGHLSQCYTTRLDQVVRVKD